MSIDSFKLQATTASSKPRTPFLPVPTTFLSSPRMLALTTKHGAHYVGIVLEAFMLLRNSPGYYIEAIELGIWAEAKGYNLKPLFEIGLLVRAEDSHSVYSHQVFEWQEPFEQARHNKAAAGALGGAAKARALAESSRDTDASESLASYSPLLSSNISFLKGGGAGEGAPPTAAAAPEPVPPAEEPPELEDVSVEAKTPPKHIELFPADPENNLPAGYLSEIEYDQYRATSGEVLIKRAAKLIREHWIKKPEKRVKKATAEMSWALTEARKQVAEDMTSKTRAVRARAGPNGLPAPISPALRKPTIAGG